MKLRYIIFTVLILIIMLIVGSSEVRAANCGKDYCTDCANCDICNSTVEGLKTCFYDFTKAIGTEMNFLKCEWYGSYNIFCIKAGAHTPTSLVIDGKMSSPNGKTFNWEGNKGTLTEEQIVKFIYIYSTLNDDIMEGEESRQSNWQSIQQQAIWSILDGQHLWSGAKAWRDQNIGKINKVLAGAEAYYKFWLNNGGEVQTKIDTSEVDLYNNKLGPFKLNFYQSTVNYNNITSTYGEIEEIKLVSSQNLGEPILCYSKSGGNILLSTTPTPDEDLYMNVEGIDITKYDSISVRFNDGYIRDAYIVKGYSKASDQQSSMYGTVTRYATTKTEKFKLSEPLEITLKKTDMEGNSISGAVFGYAAYIDYNNTGYLTTLDDANDHGLLNMTPYFKVNGNDSNILEPSEFKRLGTGWRKVEPEAKIEIGNIGKLEYLYLIFNEDIAPEGYKQLEYPIAVKFKQENKEWKLEEIGKAVWSDTEVRYSFEANTEESVASFTDNVLTIKNKKYDELTFNIIKKGRDESGNEVNLSGVKFNITAKEKTFEETTDDSGKITVAVTYDGTLGMANGTTIKIEEISTAEGYEKLSTPISITLKKQGENWELKNIIGISDNLYSFEKSTEGNLGTLTLINTKGTPPPPPPPPTTGGNVGKDEINGYVYLDGYSGVKGASGPNGSMDGNESGIKGVRVKLSDGRTTVTDDNGYYKFTNLIREQNYTVTFEYDGVNYEATTPGIGSQAREVDTDTLSRSSFNSRFETINYGQSATGIGLNYWKYGDTSNWNPIYEGRSWILKTLNESNIVINSDFTMEASTEFKLENWYQEYYNSDGSNCQNCPGHESPPDEDGNTTTTYDHCGCCWNESWTKGNQWVDHAENGGTELVEGRNPTSTGTCASNATRYRYSVTNYFICGGTTEVTTVEETEDLINKNYYKTDTSSMTPTVTSKDTRDKGVTYNLNFGLLKREVDLSLVNDLYTVDVSINGQTTTYDYADIPIRGDTVNIGNINSINYQE